jgi:hypothetical protein
MYFLPVPGSDGIGRVWTDQTSGWPNDGTPYLNASVGETLMFGLQDGSRFGLTSVDLAGYSDIVPNFTIEFVGYHSDGSTITESFSGSGLNFKTYDFSSDWSSGLTMVEIPDDGWSLDNLVVSVPEPGIGAFFVAWALTFSFWQRKRRKAK